MNENAASCIIASDINNLRAKLNREFLNGRTPIQALLMELPSNGDWMFRTELDEAGHPLVLFAMHKTSLEMLKRYPWVLSMDCTYKTNRYNMSLLDIIGFTCTGTSTYLGWAFVNDEREETYGVALRFLGEIYDHIREYAAEADNPPPLRPTTILTDKETGLINAIHTIWPETDTIICIWHVNMNLMKKARPLICQDIANIRKEGIEATYEGFTLPDEQMTKKDLDTALVKVVDEGWNKMMKR